MKLPEKAPDHLKILSSKSTLKTIAELSLSKEGRELLRKANEKYLYWDKFKYLTMPDKVSPETAWVYLKLTRSSHINQIPLLSANKGQFGFWLPDTILKELHYIDQHAGGQIIVEEPGISSSVKERYLISSLMEEAIASSQIEGAATTRKVAKEMLLSGRKAHNRQEQMVINNYTTIRKIKELTKEPLTPEILNYLQASMTEETLDDPGTQGRLRKADEPIHVTDIGDGKVLHTPPSADELPDRINLLCEFANTKEEKMFIHPVIKAILLHFWLAYDHPYVDGNGRTARALFYWYMLSNNYWLFEYLSISRIILRTRTQYSRAYLYSEIDDLDTTYFIIYNLKAVHLAIEELQKNLARKQGELQEATRQLKKYSNLNYRQIALIRHALRHPDHHYSVESHKNSHGIVYETARRDLLELVKAGLLQQFRRGKTYYFIPDPKLELRITNP